MYIRNTYLKSHSILAFLYLATLLFSCSSEEPAKPVFYEGPLREAENITMYQTEKNQMKILLKAKKINEFQNGDSEFPEGIFIEFYDPAGNVTSTLKANSAHYFKAENKWQAVGDVEVINLEKKQQLNTEELFWKPDTRKIFTEKFVTINIEEDIISGTGLDAMQDLSEYTIKNIAWDMEIDE